MKKILKLLPTIFIFFTSCASIVSDSKYPVAINTVPNEANINITDKYGSPIYSGKSPAVIPLKSGSGYFSKARYNIEITKDGYLPIHQHISSSLDPWFFGNIIFGGLIGVLIVDPLTGAMYEIDNQNLYVSLSKE